MFDNKGGKKSHEIRSEDIGQLIFGSCLLAVPVAFTEEIWRIGESLHHFNVLLIVLFSLFVIAVVIFHSGYKPVVVELFDFNYWKKIIASYVVILLTVSFLLFLIDKAPWVSSPIIALKRTIILALPASLSAVTADMIK